MKDCTYKQKLYYEEIGFELEREVQTGKWKMEHQQYHET